MRPSTSRGPTTTGAPRDQRGVSASTKRAEADLHGIRDDDLELALLTAAFVFWYGATMRAVHTLVLHVLNLGMIPLDDPSVRRIVLAGRAAAVAVDATTRRLIAERIAAGLEQGLTASQIAYGTADFAGIDGLFEETWRGRPLMVARTELQKAQLLATVQRFQTVGRGIVTGLLAHDGDFDEACADRNGREYPVNNPPDLLHPNCRLTVSPIINGQA
jgi:hypothetical protein